MSINSELQVVFGTGPLGLAVMRELDARGKPVRMVNRRGQAKVPAGVAVVQADASDVDQRQPSLQRGQRGVQLYQCGDHQMGGTLAPRYGWDYCRRSICQCETDLW